jgi:hypothetical protein
MNKLMEKQKSCYFFSSSLWRHDIYNNDTLHIDTHHNITTLSTLTKYSNIQHVNTQNHSRPKIKTLQPNDTLK